MTWTQPICNACWDALYPGRPMTTVPDGPGERCAICGVTTYGGIYIRRDPATVPYPREDE